MQEKIKALALLSGGLDSRLAVRLVQNQGIEVTALHFTSVFCTCTASTRCKVEGKLAGEELGIPVRIVDNTRELLKVVEDPPHGYGSNLNPCIDCRIVIFRMAREIMQEEGASFLVTGEVLGQRPMSQRRNAMKLIEREGGVEGLVLRPLCARHLPPSIPEQKGWVKREELLDIKGRSRKRQMELARELNAGDYPCPAGGCLLTDPGFARKMRDLLEHKPFTLNDVHLLKVGRHFRLDSSTKVVVGKNEEDNLRLKTFSRGGDMLLELADTTGPLTLLRGNLTPDNLRRAGSLCARYSRLREEKGVGVKYWRQGGEEEGLLNVEPLSPQQATSLLIVPG